MSSGLEPFPEKEKKTYFLKPLMDYFKTSKFLRVFV
jgi:hypothetical protein